MKVCLISVMMVVVAVAFISGCTSNREYKAYQEDYNRRSYFVQVGDNVKDWVLDATDVVSLEFAVGEGLGAYAQPTKHLAVGGLLEDVVKVGWRGRSAGFYREVRKEGGVSWLYYRDLRLYPLTGTSGLFMRPPQMKDFTVRHNITDRHWLDVGGEVMIIGFGASAFVSPKETMDLFINTISLPFDLTLRPLLALGHVYPPEFDMGDDDTAAAYRAKHGAEVIHSYEQFAPAEALNKTIQVPN